MVSSVPIQNGIHPASFMIADTGGFAEGDGVAEVGHVAGQVAEAGRIAGHAPKRAAAAESVNDTPDALTESKLVR